MTAVPTPDRPELPKADFPPGTYRLIKRVVVDENGHGRFVDEPGGVAVAGLAPWTLSVVEPVPPAVSVSPVDTDGLAEIISEYSHACPHCPADKPEWVVGEDQVAEIVRRALSSPSTDPAVPQAVWDAVRPVADRAAAAGQNAYWTWHAVYTALRALGYTVDDGTRPATDPEPVTPDVHAARSAARRAIEIVAQDAARRSAARSREVGLDTESAAMAAAGAVCGALRKAGWLTRSEPVAPAEPTLTSYYRLCVNHLDDQADHDGHCPRCQITPLPPAVPEDPGTCPACVSGAQHTIDQIQQHHRDGLRLMGEAVAIARGDTPTPTWTAHEVEVSDERDSLHDVTCRSGCGNLGAFLSEDAADDAADSHRADTTRPAGEES